VNESFAQYVAQCDEIMLTKVGLHCDDMPDVVSIRDYYDSQIPPANFVEDLLVECGGGGL
jgi:hypothetical protein